MSKYPYTEHDDGIVLTRNATTDEFERRPMTPVELAAREPALAVAKDIYRHANQAGVCYYEIWLLIVKAMESVARPSLGDKELKIAREAIEMFLEYRDKHGRSEEAAKECAVNEFAEAQHYDPVEDGGRLAPSPRATPEWKELLQVVRYADFPNDADAAEAKILAALSHTEPKDPLHYRAELKFDGFTRTVTGTYDLANLDAPRSATVPPILAQEFQDLAKFYDVDSLEALVRIQAQHVERLQKKLPPLKDEKPGYVPREG